MRYFNGFSLHNEAHFFREMVPKSNYCVAGFSYGAQQALEYTLEATERIDRLILLSPAFFQRQKPSFVRTQLRYFSQQRERYIETFLHNVAYPSSIDLTPYLQPGSYEALEQLLTYQWRGDALRTLQAKGVMIEVFLGGEDRIVQSRVAYDFFAQYTTTYLIKKAGHLLATP